MIFSKEGFGRIDYPLVIAVILLCIIGIMVIYSAGFDPIDKVNSGLYRRQILWFIFGFILMIGMTIISYQALGEYSLHIYAVLVAILLFTTIFGKPVRNTRAWINFFGIFSIQPSEFMKLGLVIVLAKYLEIRERDMNRLRELVIPTLLTFVPVLIILQQPDFGTAVIFIPILFAMFFVGGADVTHLVSIVLIAAIAIIVPMILTYREWVGAEGSNFLLDFFQDVNLILIVSAVLLVIAITCFVLHYFSVSRIWRKIYIPAAVISLGLGTSAIIQKLFKTYQKKRILVFLNPDLDPQGSGYNIIQSKIAIGSGGLFGKGFLQGSQAQLGFLPEKSSDFIFSVVAEEWGMIGALITIGLFAFVIARGIQTALEAKDKFSALLASGITTIFLFHVVINVGMTLGIMPVTGLPLCFVSYGGSNLLMSMIAIGILLNIRGRRTIF